MKQVTIKELYCQGITKQVDSLLHELDGIYIMEKEYQSYMKVKEIGVTHLRTTVIGGEFIHSSYIVPMSAVGTVKKLRKVIVIKEGRYYNEMPFIEAFEEIAKSLI